MVGYHVSDTSSPSFEGHTWWKKEIQFVQALSMVAAIEQRETVSIIRSKSFFNH